MRVAIVGSRTLIDKEEVFKIIKENLNKDDTIVSGGAKGIDTLAEQYAVENNIPVTIFKPNWELYGKVAGLIRNRTIVDNCDKIIAIKTISSKGTEHTIKLAKSKGLEVLVFII